MKNNQKKEFSILVFKKSIAFFLAVAMVAILMPNLSKTFANTRNTTANQILFNTTGANDASYGNGLVLKDNGDGTFDYWYGNGTDVATIKANLVTPISSPVVNVTVENPNNNVQDLNVATQNDSAASGTNQANDSVINIGVYSNVIGLGSRATGGATLNIFVDGPVNLNNLNIQGDEAVIIQPVNDLVSDSLTLNSNDGFANEEGSGPTIPSSQVWFGALSVGGSLTINGINVTANGTAASGTSCGILLLGAGVTAITFKVTGGSTVNASAGKAGVFCDDSNDDLVIDQGSHLTGTAIQGGYTYGVWVNGTITVGEAGGTTTPSSLTGYSQTTGSSTGILCEKTITVTDSNITGAKNSAGDPTEFGILSNNGFVANAIKAPVVVNADGLSVGLGNYTLFGKGNQGYLSFVSGNIQLNSGSKTNNVTVKANIHQKNGVGIENQAGLDAEFFTNKPSDVPPSVNDGNVLSTPYTVIDAAGKDNAIFATGSANFNNSTVTATTTNIISDPATYGSVTIPGDGTTNPTKVPGFAAIFGGTNTNSYLAPVSATAGSVVTENYNNTNAPVATPVGGRVQINGTYAGNTTTPGSMNNIGKIKDYTWTSSVAGDVRATAKTSVVPNGEIVALLDDAALDTLVTGTATGTKDASFNATHIVNFYANTKVSATPVALQAVVATNGLTTDTSGGTATFDTNTAGKPGISALLGDTSHTVTATANKGFHFVDWTSDNALDTILPDMKISTQQTVTMPTVDSVLTANFVGNNVVMASGIDDATPPNTIAGAGTTFPITLQASDESTPSNNKDAPTAATTVTAVAPAIAGYDFVNWEATSTINQASIQGELTANNNTATGTNTTKFTMPAFATGNDVVLVAHYKQNNTSSGGTSGSMANGTTISVPSSGQENPSTGDHTAGALIVAASICTVAFGTVIITMKKKYNR